MTFRRQCKPQACVAPSCDFLQRHALDARGQQDHAPPRRQLLQGLFEFRNFLAGDEFALRRRRFVRHLEHRHHLRPTRQSRLLTAAIGRDVERHAEQIARWTDDGAGRLRLVQMQPCLVERFAGQLGGGR